MAETHETDSTEVPAGFWAQIEHQIDRIADQKPRTFDEIREILMDLAYDKVVAEVHLNGTRRFDPDSAFFAGSGGDLSLPSALELAGWQLTAFAVGYHCVFTHESSGEVLTYTEGDVQRGDLINPR